MADTNMEEFVEHGTKSIRERECTHGKSLRTRHRRTPDSRLFRDGTPSHDHLGDIFNVRALSSVEPADLSNHPLGKFRVDPPVAGFVGVGQRGAANSLPEAH